MHVYTEKQMLFFFKCFIIWIDLWKSTFWIFDTRMLVSNRHLFVIHMAVRYLELPPSWLRVQHSNHVTALHHMFLVGNQVMTAIILANYKLFELILYLPCLNTQDIQSPPSILYSHRTTSIKVAICIYYTDSKSMSFNYDLGHIGLLIQQC